MKKNQANYVSIFNMKLSVYDQYLGISIIIFYKIQVHTKSGKEQ